MLSALKNVIYRQPLLFAYNAIVNEKEVFRDDEEN